MRLQADGGEPPVINNVSGWSGPGRGRRSKRERIVLVHREAFNPLRSKSNTHFCYGARQTQNEED